MRDFKELVQKIIDSEGYIISEDDNKEPIISDKKNRVSISLSESELCIIPKREGNTFLKKAIVRKMQGSDWESVEFAFSKENGVRDDYCVAVRINDNNYIEIRYYYGKKIMSISPSVTDCYIYDFINEKGNTVSFGDFKEEDILDFIIDTIKRAYSNKAWNQNIDELIRVLEPALSLCVKDFRDEWKNTIIVHDKNSLLMELDLLDKQIEEVKVASLYDLSGKKDIEYNELVRKRRELYNKLLVLKETIKIIQNENKSDEDYYIETMGSSRK